MDGNLFENTVVADVISQDQITLDQSRPLLQYDYSPFWKSKDQTGRKNKESKTERTAI